MSAERDAAAVGADVVFRLLALWCVVKIGYLLVSYSPAMVLSSEHSGTLDLATAAATAMLMLLIAGLLASPHLVRRLAGWSLRERPAPAGAGWVAVGLPLLAIWLGAHALVDIAFEVHDALRFDIWIRVGRATPAAVLALLLLAAAPALTRVWASANRQRVRPNAVGGTVRE